jgi:steroid 5-alpha reductase family enzyme
MVLALSYGVNLAITAGLTIIMQLSFFVVAFWMQFDKLTDLAGALNFLGNALLIFVLRGTYFPKQIIGTSLLGLWAVRLGGFLFYRVLIFGKDDRFDEMRSHFWSFLGFWIFQIIWVWTVSLPVTAINSSPLDPGSISALDIIGYVFFSIGLFSETVSDFQKFSFSVTKRDHPEALASPFMKTGLWHYSRHPNYFGEVLVWIGFWFMALGGYKAKWGQLGVAFISFCSPGLTFLLLAFLSGMPIAEKSANQKYGTLPEYLAYRDETSPFFIIPPILYRHLPPFLRKTLLMEWPLYARGLQ